MNRQKMNVLLISVDALKPEFITDPKKYGVCLPNISEFFTNNGVYASKGVKSVFPSFTYTCHQTIITGTYPDTHGIYNNIMFDPDGSHKGAWHWFVSDHVPTLWKLAKEHGYCSASVAFPTSVGAQGDYIVPEFWWDGSGLDTKFIDAVSVPQGLASEMEKEIGRFPGGLDLTIDGDCRRKEAAVWLLRNKIKARETEVPFFMTTYFASYDETAHVNGVYSAEALSALEQIDQMVGDLIKTAYEISDRELLICLVSDHGSLDNHHCIRPNVKLKEAGLISVNSQNQVSSWRAWSQRAGGTCEIRLKDEGDLESSEKLKLLMEQLRTEHDNGILEVLTGDQARLTRKGFSKAAYVLVAQKGYEIRDDVCGDYMTTELVQKAQHGYSEEFDEMRASFCMIGPDIPKGKDLGSCNLVDVAPTLAAVMEIPMPTAQGENLCKRFWTED
ncbi:alkaline phosphatase family protein [Acidaminobacter hydrogenoformans]|uniref:Predicted pyrophosphatase or phosphodiesterase, AlkP superfamily n=1 Tax=Acidaminobacter hydrogenoformans DSM 2784 TaxID=1120920 RepID=A0A1G5RUT9_9FIRM|nr:ectonucleotide pyrophosphatase/phosphodiesterase [Acidaminobacter hydrogenoformans]SCZ77638.1 Predicted pyrophosphatase or phosphodiesterase, AlkP superfamily [Acidaminobacter hydrogenoformans DSM 2784]